MVKIMQQYLPENGIKIIDHKYFVQARYQIKETYKWGGTYKSNFFNICKGFHINSVLWG